MLPYVRVVSATPSTTAKVLTVFIKGGPLYKFRKSGKLRSQYFQGHPYILLVSRFMSPSFLQPCTSGDKDVFIGDHRSPLALTLSHYHPTVSQRPSARHQYKTVPANSILGIILLFLKFLYHCTYHKEVLPLARIFS